MDDFFFKSLILNAMQGLIASQTDDRRYIDHPDYKKEAQIADDAFKLANEFMKRFKEIDDAASKPD
jgi:hypothetical protein